MTRKEASKRFNALPIEHRTTIIAIDEKNGLKT